MNDKLSGHIECEEIWKRRLAPGEHNGAVFGERPGIDEAEIAALRDGGVIRSM